MIAASSCVIVSPTHLGWGELARSGESYERLFFAFNDLRQRRLGRAHSEAGGSDTAGRTWTCMWLRGQRRCEMICERAGSGDSP
jgi:hypothetical protein